MAQKDESAPERRQPLSTAKEHEIEAHLAAIAKEVFDLATKRVGVDLGTDPKRSSAARADWLLVHPYGMPPNFTGRAGERRRLTEWLEKENGSALLALRALGGFGKSALVWHWLMKDLDPARWLRVVWWSFYDDPSFDAFLGRVAAYLGLEPVKGGARETVEQLTDTLRRSRVLLVLDGFERALRAFAQLDAAYHLDDEEERLGKEEERDCVSLAAEAFLRAVSSLPGLAGRVLLTTRLRPRPVETRAGELLAGCQEIELTALSKADAVDFFHAEGIRGTRAEIETVCGYYGFHPLSLRLLAGMIVKDLRNPRDIAVAQQLDVSGDLVQRKHHVLEQSYESLSAEGRRLLSRIACFRGAIAYDAIEECVAAPPKPEPWYSKMFSSKKGTFDLATTVQDLTFRGLLYRDESAGRFDLHPIVRRYAYDRLGKEEKEETHRNLRDFFAAVPAIKKVETLADLTPVIELYHQMVRAGEYDAARELFRDRFGETMYYQLGAYESLIELLRALFPNGEDRPPRLRKESDQSWTLNALALSYNLSGQPRRAVPLLQQAAVIDDRLDDKNNLAAGLGNLAIPQIGIGNLRFAEGNFRRSIEICRETANSWHEEIARGELGRLLLIRSLWEEAGAELAAALSEFAKVNSVQSQGIIWAHRALLHLQRCRARETIDPVSDRESSLAAARRTLELADETARTMYPHERDYVRAHWLLGAAWRESGNFDHAERHLTEVLERCRRVNSVDIEADILIDLGRLRREQGDAAEARRLGEEAVTIAERCGYVLQGADAHLLLAELDRVEGKTAQAREHASEARRLATCDGPPDYTYKVAYDEAGAMLELL